MKEWDYVSDQTNSVVTINFDKRKICPSRSLCILLVCYFYVA